MGTGEFNAGGNPAMNWCPIGGGGGKHTPASLFMLLKPGYELRPDEPLASYTGLTCLPLFVILTLQPALIFLFPSSCKVTKMSICKTKWYSTKNMLGGAEDLIMFLQK